MAVTVDRRVPRALQGMVALVGLPEVRVTEALVEPALRVEMAPRALAALAPAEAAEQRVTEARGALRRRVAQAVRASAAPWTRGITAEPPERFIRGGSGPL